MKKLHKLLIAACFSWAAGMHAQSDKGIIIPSEEEVARVYMASLALYCITDPPKTIVIYPKMDVDLNGKNRVLGTTAAVFAGKEASKFIDFLRHPTDIRISEIGCDHVFFTSERGDTQKVISGEVRFYKGDQVLVRLHIDNAIYTKVDFFYEGVGFKKWIMDHSTTLKAEK